MMRILLALALILAGTASLLLGMLSVYTAPTDIQLLGGLNLIASGLILFGVAVCLGYARKLPAK